MTPRKVTLLDRNVALPHPILLLVKAVTEYAQLSSFTLNDLLQSSGTLVVARMVIVMASRTGAGSVEIAMRTLRSGGSALDAVEAGVKAVEDDPKEITVGYGGLPNLVGQVELDASIMDGATLRAGAVAGITHFKNPISIARRIMEKTPHVMLVGEGAEAFAEIEGFQRTNLLTPESKAEYEKLIEGKVALYSEFYKNSGRALTTYKNIQESMLKWYTEYVALKRSWGTVNFIAVDKDHNVAAGVSTSGTALKMPGRTGDSPIIGAGNYADNKAGAAACTGRGELAIRVCLAKYVVDLMGSGVRVDNACVMGIRKVLELQDPIGTSMNIIAINRNGNGGSASVEPDTQYYYQDQKMDRPQKRMATYVAD